MKGVNPAIVDQVNRNAEVLTSDFLSGVPFEHIIFDDFLSTELCQSLFNDFPGFDEKMALNENGEVGKKAVNQHIASLSRSYKHLDQLVQDQDFITMVSQITGIPNLIYDKHYFGGGTHENLQDQGLDPHVDFTHHPVTGHYRRLNLIIYLNHQWEAHWGGCLDLHKNPYLSPDEDEIVSINPVFNRAVIFATHHHSWHGFKPINLPEAQQRMSRKSIALYYYTKEQPSWFKQSHSTIYVDRHMSTNVQANTVLSATDYAEIKRLFATRDQHIQRLYKTISYHMDEVSKIKRLLGPLWKLSWPLRKIRRYFKKS